jgi:hypothetical protein
MAHRRGVYGIFGPDIKEAAGADACGVYSEGEL